MASGRGNYEVIKEPGRSNVDGWCPIRLVMIFLAFIGACIEFILRYSIGVAIVAMVNTTTSTNTTLIHNTSHSTVCPAALNESGSAHHTKGGGEYDWSLEEQGVILGTFFWGYLITKCIGGRIAEIFGGTLTFGLTLGICGIISLLCPLAASLHPMALAALRLLMGLFQGPAVPALYWVIAQWARPKERTTLMLSVYAGLGAGLVVGLGLSGMIVDMFGWKWVFYGGGLITLIWVPFWFLLVRDKPAKHPFISDREKAILSEITVESKKHVPWSKMARCRSIYILILVEFSMGWMATFPMVQAPTFFTDQIGMNLATSGQMMLVATSVTTIMCFVFGWLSDFLYVKEIMTKLNVRRFIYISGGVLIIGGSVGIVLAGCNQIMIYVLFVTVMFGIPSQAAAYQLTPIDIAPNYSGTIIGIVGLGQLGSFLAPIVNARIAPLENGWDIVIVLSCLIYVVIGVLYVFGVTADEQEWNLYEEIRDDDEDNTQTQETNEHQEIT